MRVGHWDKSRVWQTGLPMADSKGSLMAAAKGMTTELLKVVSRDGLQAVVMEMRLAAMRDR
jgi:hypothetical protein